MRMKEAKWNEWEGLANKQRQKKKKGRDKRTEILNLYDDV